MDTVEVVRKYCKDNDVYIFEDSTLNSRASKTRKHAVKVSLWVTPAALAHIKKHGYVGLENAHVGVACEDAFKVRCGDGLIAEIFPRSARDISVIDFPENNNVWENRGKGKSTSEKLALVQKLHCLPVIESARIQGGMPDKIIKILERM